MHIAKTDCSSEFIRLHLATCPIFWEFSGTAHACRSVLTGRTDHHAKQQSVLMYCRPLDFGITPDDLLRDCDWLRERAEACVAARASGQELPPAWHSAETAFQCFFRAVGVLQVSNVARSEMRRSHLALLTRRGRRPHQSPCVCPNMNVVLCVSVLSCWSAAPVSPPIAHYPSSPVYMTTPCAGATSSSAWQRR